uniref:disease resistance protein RPV1-like n=1 Tax=Erigeron canadensis TaxID=72917 RepID=UPI001CB8C4BD|nr:disease resistance protein RPV1-like [Erigeron canadensis]
MSFQSSHASCKSWNYDIFVSFRGVDTRNTFVDHLYAALDQRRITYLNLDKLPQGELMGPLLFKAIKESQIVIVVFSKNYADSFLCLNELVSVTECMEEKGQIVIPVYYDVDASYVRNQKGTYEESFARHELLHNKDKVESWRKALVYASNLCGWDLKYNANG